MPSISNSTVPWNQGGLFILPIFVLAVVSAGEPVAATVWLIGGGLLSGFLSGMLGIGGALVTVPVLYVVLPLCGVPADALAQVVVASALTAMVPTAFRATWINHRCGWLDRGWLLRLALWMLLGGVGGAILATRLDGTVLAVAFAAQALYYGGGLLLRPDNDATRTLLGRVATRVPSCLAGPGIAAFCSCVGMGGGSMINPYLRAHGMDLRTALATTGALNLCIALGGSLAFWAAPAAASGPSFAPAWGAALLLGIAAVAAIPLGVGMSRRLATGRLTVLVGSINVVSALVLIGKIL